MSIRSAHVRRVRCVPGLRRSIAIVCMVSGLGGCMPAAMRVETANHPQHVDEDVRYRTTYYFRVFDICLRTDGTTEQVNHALYRFKMTGKARSLTNAVHFESGTLAKEEIDAFGSNVRFDDKQNGFVLVSKDEARRQYVAGANLDQAQRLVKLRGELNALASDANTKPAEKAALESLIEKLTRSVEQQMQLDGVPTSPVAEGERVAKLAQQLQTEANNLDATQQLLKTALLSAAQTLNAHAASIVTRAFGDATTATDAGTNCLNRTRGFQVLGPEGISRFDQNSRLLLAMSSSGRPLISTLQELSGRVLNSAASSSELTVPVLEAHRQVSKADLAIAGSHERDGAERVETALNNAAAALAEGAGR